MKEDKNMNAKHEKFVNEITRKCVDTYTLDNNYRVKVYTYHDKVKKVYWSVISECTVEASGTAGFYFEKHSMYTDLNRLAGKVEALRYNPENMKKAHESALYSVRELVDQLLEAGQAREKVSA
jgi:hypothetical protein